MATKTEICNGAVVFVGGKSILQSVDVDNSREADLCRTLWQPMLDAALREAPWGHCEARVQLTTVAGTVAKGYAYAYKYPADCMLARRLVPDIEGQDPIPFKVLWLGAERAICTNAEEPVLEYNFKQEDPAHFDSLFSDALSMRIATRLAVPLTGKENRYRMASAEYQMAVAKAYAAARLEQEPEKTPDTDWIRARS
jgi:hypothetical protein